MTTTLTMRDGRLLARIINLAHRFGCTYTRVAAQQNGDAYAATIELHGPRDALRRLDLQLTKLLSDDKETFS